MDDTGHHLPPASPPDSDRPQRQTLRISQFRLLAERHDDLVNQLTRIAAGADAEADRVVRTRRRVVRDAPVDPIQTDNCNGTGSQ